MAALSDLLGAERTAEALAPLSQLYDPVGTETATMRFAQAAMLRPLAEDDVDLGAYRGLTDRYRDIEYVLRRVREVAVPAVERELDAGATISGGSSGDQQTTAAGDNQVESSELSESLEPSSPR